MRKIFRLASEKDFELIFELYNKCTKDLIKRGIIQWDDAYPTQDRIKSNIENKSQYIYSKNNKLIGSFVLNEIEDEYWQKISWLEDKFIGLHLLAIDPNFQNKGYGKKVIDFCEDYAKNNNYKSIHLDVFSKNNGALKLYQNKGYQKVGELRFEFKPNGNQKYFCYEKILKDD